MRGLTLIVAGSDPERLRSALTLAAAQAALGGRARLFADSPAVPLFAPPMRPASDDRHADAGLPRLAELVETALELGVTITLCQSGLAMRGVDAASLDPRIAIGGMTSLLAGLADDRLVAL